MNVGQPEPQRRLMGWRPLPADQCCLNRLDGALQVLEFFLMQPRDLEDRARVGWFSQRLLLQRPDRRFIVPFGNMTRHHRPRRFLDFLPGTHQGLGHLVTQGRQDPRDK